MIGSKLGGYSMPTELPVAFPVNIVLEVGFGGIIGLETGGRREFMPIKVLDAALGKAADALLGGRFCDARRADPGGIPNRVAIICALSCKSLCFDRSNSSLTLSPTFSISAKKANLVSSLYNCNQSSKLYKVHINR